MERILGLTLEELSLRAMPSPRYDAEPEELEQNQAKAIRFGESVLGRELLNYLPIHRCSRGCDSVELAVAEMLAAKRPLNPQALGRFAKLFSYHVRNAEGEMLDIMRENGWNVRQYLEQWINEFLLRGVDVLHGDLEPEELFGSGYARETWTRLEEFLELSKAQ